MVKRCGVYLQSNCKQSWIIRSLCRFHEDRLHYQAEPVGHAWALMITAWAALRPITAASCRKDRAFRTAGPIGRSFYANCRIHLIGNDSFPRNSTNLQNAVPNAIVSQDFHETPPLQRGVEGLISVVTRTTLHPQMWMLMFGQDRWSRVPKSQRVS
jgi:hypothetical protein